LINSDYSIDKNIHLSLIGLPDEDLTNIREEFKTEFMNNYIKLNNDQKSSDQNVRNMIIKNLKYVFKNFLRNFKFYQLLKNFEKKYIRKRKTTSKNE